MKTIHTKRHEKLIEFIITERKRCGIRQTQLAARLRRSQTWIARLEGGDRRIDVVELIDLAEAIGFNASSIVRALQKVK